MFLVTNENMGLCLYIISQKNYVWFYSDLIFKANVFQNLIFTEFHNSNELFQEQFQERRVGPDQSWNESNI